jgi:RNA-splicing ligase RtcB
MTETHTDCPGMVGVDIGCGMETTEIAEATLDFALLDKVIRKNVPAGREVREKCHKLNDEIDLAMLRCANNLNIDRARQSIGTLGGGNHFIEVDCSGDGRLFLVVHSGSRHLGLEVATYYQNEAWISLCDSNAQQVPKDLAYLSGSLFDDYIYDMRIIQHFANLNRQAMTDVILQEMGLTKVDAFTTTHNYIDIDAMILRKGAVSAKHGEKLLIPINMRDGSLVCIGKGNAEWNYSAPHGAGRTMSRRVAKSHLSMDEYKKQMEGIFTTSVTKDTLDESPMAYKDMDVIVNNIEPTASILMRIKPIYNFKASE